MALISAEKKFGFKFKNMPLVIGGKAMEFYGLRKAGKDIDLILDKKDHLKLHRFLEQRSQKGLAEKMEGNKIPKPTFFNIGKDQCIAIDDFEFWDRFMKFDYDSLSIGAHKKDKYLVIALEKLLVLKALKMSTPKHFKDLQLIVKFLQK